MQKKSVKKPAAKKEVEEEEKNKRKMMIRQRTLYRWLRDGSRGERAFDIYSCCSRKGL
jgi:hypothetical protein